jgi:CRISPR/Cas system-associated exonuclease Cas4 (RecB family)
MQLPDHFAFSQHNLQDYVDCPRRFYLRYLLRQDWPAVESQPVQEQERLIELGQRFHLLVQQYFAGLPLSALEATIDEPELLTWWQAFLTLELQNIPGSKKSEIQYTIPFAGSRLLAKYDLLVANPAEKSYTIYDWKTSQHPPQEKWLNSRLQTRVYPFVLSTLQATQPGFAPEQIKMIYWYPAAPAKLVEFAYSQQQFAADEHSLTQLIHEIRALDESGFSLTEDERKCKFCRYRSLCNRGTLAGNLLDQSVSTEDLDAAFDIDFEQLDIGQE